MKGTPVSRGQLLDSANPADELAQALLPNQAPSMQSSPPPGASPMQELTQPSRVQKIGNILAGFGAGMQGRGQEFLANQQALSDKRKQAAAKDLYTVNTMITSAAEEAKRRNLKKGSDEFNQFVGRRAVNFMNNRLHHGRRLNANMNESMALIDLIRSDPLAAQQSIDEDLMVARLNGYLPQPKYEYQGDQWYMVPPYGPPVPVGVNQVSKEELKANRNSVQQRSETLQKDAFYASETARKISGLLQEVQGGNPQSVAGAIVSLVQLLEPGLAVRADDMRTAINVRDPVASSIGLIRDIMKGEGFDDGAIDGLTGQLEAIRDPLNTDNISIDNFVNTVSTILDAKIPSYQERFNAFNESVYSGQSEEFRNKALEPVRKLVFEDYPGLVGGLFDWHTTSQKPGTNENPWMRVMLSNPAALENWLMTTDVDLDDFSKKDVQTIAETLPDGPSKTAVMAHLQGSN